MAVRHTLEIRLFQNPAAASVRKFFRIINPAGQPVHIAFISDLITITWQLASPSPHFTGQAEKIRPPPPAPGRPSFRQHLLTISIYNISCQFVLTA
jgi:hypothetical protein